MKNADLLGLDPITELFSNGYSTMDLDANTMHDIIYRYRAHLRQISALITLTGIEISGFGRHSKIALKAEHQPNADADRLRSINLYTGRNLDL